VKEILTTSSSETRQRQMEKNWSGLWIDTNNSIDTGRSVVVQAMITTPGMRNSAEERKNTGVANRGQWDSQAKIYSGKEMKGFYFVAVPTTFLGRRWRRIGLEAWMSNRIHTWSIILSA
jgi:hypothetical protein